MRPIQGATYRHYKGGLYMVTGFSFDEETRQEHVLYASVTDGIQYNQPIKRFMSPVKDPDADREISRFSLEIPSQPSIGLPAVGYLWTNVDTGNRMLTLVDDPIQERDMDPNIRREAVVRLSDAFAKWQFERVQSMAKDLKNTM